MVATSGSFPHPVMGNGDDVFSRFEISSATTYPSIENVIFKFRVVTDDPQIKDLLISESAQFCVWWNCSATISSGLIEPIEVRERIDGWDFTCAIDQDSIIGTVEVQVELIATKELPEFRWSRQHEEYGHERFHVRKGDYLGLAGKFEFDAKKLYDLQTPPLGSIFRVQASHYQNEPLKVAFTDSEQIIVNLSPEAANKVNDLGSLDSVKLSLVVLPALMETLNYIARQQATDAGEDLSEHIWYKELVRLVEFHKISLDSSLDVAQKLLNFPLINTLGEILLTESEES